MSYTIKWRPQAVKGLRKIPKEIAKKLVRRVNASKKNPKSALEKMEDDDTYKCRQGDYRAIIDILEDQKIIAVKVVDHRRNIYKNR